jgi:hypothetical protein
VAGVDRQHLHIDSLTILQATGEEQAFNFNFGYPQFTNDVKQAAKATTSYVMMNSQPGTGCT